MYVCGKEENKSRQKNIKVGVGMLRVGEGEKEGNRTQATFGAEFECV